MKFRINFNAAIPFVIIAAVSTVGFQDKQEDKLKYESGKSILYYSYSVNKDSIYFVGRLEERIGKAPILNMNIEVKNHRIGTVPDRNGKFKIFLPDRKGTLIFNKIAFEKFEFNYSFPLSTMH